MGIQVYTATHDGEHNKLSAGAKRFISFNYDGKDIEDFNLIATITSNRIQQNLYSNFSDSTTQYYGIDGQQYWGSTLQPLTLNFTLSTDGMEEKEIEAFKHHFSPNKIAKLFLSERPNRYSFARVAAAPSMSLLPFRKEITFLGEKIYTTEFKGDITLSLILDEPYWFSDWALPPQSSLTPEQKRIIYEDGLPIMPADAKSFTPYNILFADKILFQRVAGGENGDPFNLFNKNNLTVFNCGSAMANTILTFDFSIGQLQNNMVTFPKNDFTNPTQPYNYIKLEKAPDQVQWFKFTIPSFLYSHNKIVQLLTEINNQIEEDTADKDIFHLRAKLIEVLPNYNYRKIALEFYDNFYHENVELTIETNNSIIAALKEKIENMFFSVKFDSKIGQSIITYFLNGIKIVENCGEMVCSEMLKVGGGDRYLIKDNGSITYYGHTLTTDATRRNPLQNFSMEYKYTYY